MSWSTRVAQALACVFLSLPCLAGPVDFGLAEYNAALAARNLKWKVKYDVSTDPPETYRIEPYSYGGAHITGGDLRGLMYGLLDAADQVRSTGHLKLTHSVPSTSIRAIRRFARDDLADWRPYFETLARDRFNRFTLIYTEPPGLDRGTLEKLRAISQLAADYGVDFTLGLWYEPSLAPGPGPTDTLDKIIAASPLIRTFQIRSASHDLDAYRTRVFPPLHRAGHRIALDPDPEIVDAARQAGVAIRTDPPTSTTSLPTGWPPNFDIEAPADFETHAEFYWLWGQLSYDPKSKPEHGENADEFHAAAQIVALIAMAKAPANDWIASIGEAVGNRVNNVASAKRTPLDICDSLASAAAQLQSSGVSDLQLLATLARDEATRLRASYDAAISSNAPPSNANSPEPLLSSGSDSGLPAPPVPARPQLTHAIVHSAPPGQPINLTLQIAPIKDVLVVRLHYRALDSSTTSVIEKPAAASITLTIPPMPSDLLYYFEILNRSNGGWFEPDPSLTTPFHIIHIEPKQ
jgi:hypothetical protein